MDLQRFKPGDELVLQNGARAEVLAPTEDGQWIRVRYLDSPEYPSLTGTEDLVAEGQVSGFSPAPPGPEWGESVSVVLHHVPESEESEEAYEAVTMGGTPLGVSITAESPGNPREALERLLGALAAFGYSGRVAVQDVAEAGISERYEVEVVV